jgi:hypothetical protein
MTDRFLYKKKCFYKVNKSETRIRLKGKNIARKVCENRVK